MKKAHTKATLIQQNTEYRIENEKLKGVVEFIGKYIYNCHSMDYKEFNREVKPKLR